MSEYGNKDNSGVEFKPWNEDEGGVQRTPAEQSEIDRLESDFKAPPVDLYKRIENQPNAKNHPEGIKSFFVSRKFGRRSSLATIILLLFGGGGFLTVFFTPAIALNQFTTMMTQSLNDQMHAVEERSSMLLQAKLSEVTKGSCGLVKVACRFASMNDTQVKRFKDAGIEVDRKPSVFFKNRGQITEMRFTGSDGKEVKISSAEQLHRMSLDNIEFRAAKTTAYNSMFATLKDKVVTNVLNRLKARTVPITGDTDEERQKNLNDRVAGVNTAHGPPIIETEDKDKGTKYTVNGEEISSTQADTAKDIGGTLNDITDKGGYQHFASGALRGLSVLGWAQNLCTGYTLASVASSLGQIEAGAQAARFAIEGPAATSDSIKAQEAKEGDVSFMGGLVNATTKPQPAIDESGISKAGSIDTLPTTTTKGGETAFDSITYKYAADREVPNKVSIEDAKYMLGGGTPTALDTGLNSTAHIISPDDPTQKGVRAKCRWINNPVVVLGALGAGIVLGVGSFGVTTAIGVGVSVAASLVTPYFLSKIADTMSGNTYKNLSGKPLGLGSYVGLGTFLGKVAQFRGGKPLNKEEGVKYLEKNLAANAAYNETQEYIARATPLDASNRYSFLGSIIYNMVPLVERSKTNASTAMMNMASFIPSAFASLNPTVKAASVPANYFSCNDPNILAAGINADFMCVVHYGETESGLKIQPVANALWMAETGNIDADSETGDTKDNGQPWNYVKFLSECVNRTTGWGIPNQDDLEDGTNCTKPENEGLNEQFRAYTMYKSINDTMDTPPQAMMTDEAETYTDGQTGTVTAGWSFPTEDEAVVAQKFGESDDKNGITIAAKNSSQTEGMPIFAVYDGTITGVGNEVGLNNRIKIDHWVNGQLITSIYGNLGKNSIAVKLGEKVKAGQQIGTITSPVEGTDARLYFEMWEGPTTTGRAVDPMGTLNITRKAQEITNV